MKPCKWVSFLLIPLFLLIPCLSGETQEKKEVGKVEGKSQGFGGLEFSTSRAPIDITSDTVEANQKQNTVTFQGNVIAKQGNTTLYAKTLVIYYDPDTQKLKEMMAIGNVEVIQLGRRATGQRGTFYQNENKVVLEGEVVLREGENVIRGERVIFYIDEKRSVMEGKKGGRVSTTIIPPPKEQGESKK
jgi:lipopolysaccharide export system protein LptA